MGLPQGPPGHRLAAVLGEEIPSGALPRTLSFPAHITPHTPPAILGLPMAKESASRDLGEQPAVRTPPSSLPGAVLPCPCGQRTPALQPVCSHCIAVSCLHLLFLWCREKAGNSGSGAWPDRSALMRSFAAGGKQKAALDNRTGRAVHDQLTCRRRAHCIDCSLVEKTFLRENGKEPSFEEWIELLDPAVILSSLQAELRWTNRESGSCMRSSSNEEEMRFAWRRGSEGI